MSRYDLFKVPMNRYFSGSLSGGAVILKAGFIALFLSLAPSVCSTWQAPDTLIVEGKEYSWGAEILEDYFSEENPKPIPMSDNSMCWRGYYATWELRDDKLFLIKLQDCISGDDIWNKLLKGKTAPLLADWYSDAISIPHGKEIKNTDFYERESCYVLVNGILKNKYSVDNKSLFSSGEEETMPKDSAWFDANLVAKNYTDLKHTGKRIEVRGFYLGENLYVPRSQRSGSWKIRIKFEGEIKAPELGSAIEAKISSDQASGYIVYGFSELEEGAPLDLTGNIILQSLEYDETKASEPRDKGH